MPFILLKKSRNFILKQWGGGGASEKQDLWENYFCCDIMKLFTELWESLRNKIRNYEI